MTKKYKASDVKVGEKYWRLTVDDIKVEITKNGSKLRYCYCTCDCQNKTKVKVSAIKLISEYTKSCGCYQKERAKESRTTHGLSRERIYGIWKNMFDRCYNEKNSEFKHYGGRNIEICDEWCDIIRFNEWAVKNGYSDELTIERIDVNKDYCPNNCTWIKLADQAHNRQNTIYIEAFQERKQIIFWVNDIRCRVNEHTLRRRLKEGWNAEDAITKDFISPKEIGEKRSKKITIFEETKSIKEWSIDIRCQVNITVLTDRLQKDWNPEKAITTPLRQRTKYDKIKAWNEVKSLMAWLLDSRCKATENALRYRLSENWQPEIAISTPNLR